MYNLAIILTFFGISAIMFFLGIRLKKTYPLVTFLFFSLGVYFIMLGLGSAYLMANENILGTDGDRIKDLITTAYAIIQNIFIFVILPIFIIGIIVDIIIFIQNSIRSKKKRHGKY